MTSRHQQYLAKILKIRINTVDRLPNILAKAPSSSRSCCYSLQETQQDGHSSVKEKRTRNICKVAAGRCWFDKSPKATPKRQPEAVASSALRYASASSILLLLLLLLHLPFRFFFPLLFSFSLRALIYVCIFPYSL